MTESVVHGFGEGVALCDPTLKLSTISGAVGGRWTGWAHPKKMTCAKCIAESITGLEKWAKEEEAKGHVEYAKELRGRYSTPKGEAAT